VTAVDVDEVAVEVARENARANDVEIDARTADARGPGLPAAGLAVANISLGLVQAVASVIDADRLITAGYLSVDRPELPGLNPVRRLERDGWAGDLFRKGR
jgi:ribosomal protein L11 methylase PrmA